MYTAKNFKTKKALKDAVEACHTLSPIDGQRLHTGITYYQPGPFGGNELRDGTITLEGPHYPAPHRWYARAVVAGGVIVKVL